jgi:hypothetical protein
MLGMMAVQPQLPSASSSIDDQRITGLGAAARPRPVTGLTRLKSSRATSAALERSPICPSETSFTTSSTVSPGSTGARQAARLSQWKWCRWQRSVPAMRQLESIGVRVSRDALDAVW